MSQLTLSAMKFEDAMRLNGPIEADADCVHVWLLSLDARESDLGHCRELMSESETARAGRFLRRADRDHYIVTRGLLRQLLGLYCETRPSDIQFGLEAEGKPLLLSDRCPSLTFNLSHSSGTMLLGVAAGRPIGVDIEARDHRTDALRIAKRYFFGAEAKDIEDASDGERHARFLQYWVAKEAALKAAGVGLHYPLDALRVHFSPDRMDAKVESIQPERLPADLTVQMLPFEPGWYAAIASGGPRWRWGPMPHCGRTSIYAA
jgi:4'-phosphopantetheinyl transferase